MSRCGRPGTRKRHIAVFTLSATVTSWPTHGFHHLLVQQRLTSVQKSFPANAWPFFREVGQGRAALSGSRWERGSVLVFAGQLPLHTKIKMENAPPFPLGRGDLKPPPTHPSEYTKTESKKKKVLSVIRICLNESVSPSPSSLELARLCPVCLLGTARACCTLSGAELGLTHRGSEWGGRICRNTVATVLSSAWRFHKVWGVGQPVRLL